MLYKGIKMQVASRKIILILFHKYFENKDIDMFDVVEMRNQGFVVEVWVLVKLSYNYNIRKPFNCYEGNYVTEFKTFGQVEERISNMDMKAAFFILYPGEADDKISNSIRKSIVIHRGKYANYHYPLLLSVASDLKKNNENIFDVVKEYIFSWRKDKYNLYRDIKIFINTFLYPSTFEFFQGEVGYSRLKNKFLRLSKKCILLHSIDMDIYIRNQKRNTKNDLLKRRYAVFIDQYLEGHSDFKKEGIKSPILKKERYYRELNVFFNMIEKKYACEVVIALHPKAEYEDNPFQGRKMLFNQTHALIEKAILCILHDSTCYPFVLFLKKPYFLITTTDLKQDRLMDKCIMEYEKRGFSRVCDISLIDEERIKDYINEYNSNIHDLYVNYFMGPQNNSRLLNMSVICQLIKKKMEKW